MEDAGSGQSVSWFKFKNIWKLRRSSYFRGPFLLTLRITDFFKYLNNQLGKNKFLRISVLLSASCREIWWSQTKMN